MDAFGFGPFQFEPSEARLSRAGKPCPLTPKAIDLLHCLVLRAGHLVEKHDLLSEVWPQSVVGDAVLKVTMRELRRALGDDPKEPTFIETVRGRGYRFVAETRPLSTQDADALPPLASRGAPPRERATVDQALFVGREDLLAGLETALDSARAGNRRILFLAGEAGIGKSALLDRFRFQTEAQGGIALATGQCIEHLSSGEPYLPLLQAVARLHQGPWANLATRTFKRFAPTWVAQIPALQNEADQDAMQREVLGASRPRMLRELVEAFENFARECTLVLLLEDLQWCDLSTPEALGLLARGRESARILVLGTWRTGFDGEGNPGLRALRREVLSLPSGEEWALERMSPDQVASYLHLRFPGARLDARMAEALHRRTAGNPLFLVHACQDLEERGAFVSGAEGYEFRELPESTVPVGLRPLLDERRRRVPEEARRVLDVAAMMGSEFSAAVVAEAIDRSAESVEDLAEDLVGRHHLLERRGVERGPSGDIETRFGFDHDMLRRVIEESIPAGKRARLHRRIAAALERRVQPGSEDLALALARHYREAMDLPASIRWILHAVGSCTRRQAVPEAMGLLRQAEDWLQDGSGNDHVELALTLLEQKGVARRGMGDVSGAIEDFRRLVSTAQKLGMHDTAGRAMLLLASALFWTDRRACLEVVDRAAAASEHLDRALTQHHVRGWCGHWSLVLRGWRDEDVAACVAAHEAASEAGDAGLIAVHAVRRTYLEMLRSQYTRALEVAAQGRAQALAIGDAFDFMLSHFLGAWAALHAGLWAQAIASIDEGREVAEKNGHELWRHLFDLIEGQLAEQAGATEHAIELCQAPIEHARSNPLAAGQLLFHGQIVLGSAELRAGLSDSALGHFDAVDAVVASQPEEVDVMLHLPLRFGRGLALLRCGRHDEAATEAVRLHELSERSGEVSYRALACYLDAEGAKVRGDSKAFEAALERGLDLAADRAPLAAWRLHALRGQRDSMAKSQAIRKSLSADLATLRPSWATPDQS